MIKIRELYESKEKNAFEMISMTTLIKWCALIEELTRRLSELAAKNRRIDMTSILERLKKTIDQLERVKRIEKRT